MSNYRILLQKMDEREGYDNKYYHRKKLLFVIDDTYTDILIRNLYWKPVAAY